MCEDFHWVNFCGKSYGIVRPFSGLSSNQQVLLAVIFRREMAVNSQTEAESGKSENNSAGF
jgi:hypothetical protein